MHRNLVVGAAALSYTDASSFFGSAPMSGPVRAPLPAPIDAAVIARAQAGDAGAFRAVYERHRVDVARLVFRMLGRRADLDDVIQEVFVQVHRSLRDFRGQSKFTTWLHRVTVNVVLMYRRAARSRPVFADESVPETRFDAAVTMPDDDVDRRERMRAFARVLEKLADKKRDVFVLHELEGLAPAEIARIVGAPVLTVRTRLFYARRDLEKLMLEEPALRAALEPARGSDVEEHDAGRSRPTTAKLGPGEES
jgi:RNA polymerase sigma-70 factor (ECF subfamily)